MAQIVLHAMERNSKGKLIGKYEVLTDTSQHHHTMKLVTLGIILTRCYSNLQSMDHSILQALIINQ